MIVVGDARQIGLPDNSIDAIVTDPPYGLEFMNKDWDRLGDLGKARAGFSKGAPAVKGVRGEIKALPSYNATGNIRCRKCGKWKWGHKPGDGGGGGLGCQCKEPDFPNVKTIQAGWMQAWHYEWAIEALRVLKPGGYLLAMGGTRTFHRLACALEDAGFEIRDCMVWLYGSGFPKSYNISKGFDRKAFKAWLDVLPLEPRDCSLCKNGAIDREQYQAWLTKFRHEVAALAWFDWDEWSEDKEKAICPVCYHSVLEGWMTKAQVRKAVSAAVNGEFPPMPGGKSDKVYSESRAGRLDPEQSQLHHSEGSRLLASLLARFWKPLTKRERETVWQHIVGESDYSEWDYSIEMPPGVRVSAGKYQLPNGTEWNLEQAKNPDVSHSEPTFTASGVRTLGITAPSTPLAKKWEGFGSGLKPAWEPVVVARKPLIGTLCENAEKWGTGGLNIDRCRIGHTPGNEGAWGAINRSDSRDVYGRKWQDEDGQTPCSARNPQGRWPANLILSHSEGCVRMGTKRVKPLEGHRPNPVAKQANGQIKFSEKPPGYQKTSYTDPNGCEQAEDWICVESCPVRLLDEQSGERPGGRPIINPKSDPTDAVYHKYPNRSLAGSGRQDKGGASRFFYCAKVSRKERTANGTVVNREPTVKPIALGRYLIRLVTPLGGVVLDPFCGSGSFLVSAIEEGFDCIGMDNREEACQVAVVRCHHKAGKQGRLL